MMTTAQTYGVISFGMIAGAIVLGAIAMFLGSWLLGMAYSVLSIGSLQAVLYAFCAKCACKEHCGHIFPGKAALNIKRQPGPYTFVEIGVMGAACVLLFGAPQFWLWPYPELLAAFWGLLVVAGILIRMAMCPVCANIYCPLHQK